MKTDEINQGMVSRIIEVAKQVFVKKGYEATKMGDIAAEVGISRTAMHYYFRTKEMMFEAILRQLTGNILPNIDAIMNEESTILEKLPKIIDTYLTALRHNPLFPLFALNELNRNPKHLFNAIIKDNKNIQPMIRLRKQVEEEMQKGLINNISVIDIISTLLGTILFPLLAKNVLVQVFMNGETEAFNDFIANRKQFIYHIMYALLSPKQAPVVDFK
ncbi:TetR family transcriptional regulator [Bacteroidia bacterium]|nr:TetR family transcriptional regulator [Bacteroidia bacterium]